MTMLLEQGTKPKSLAVKSVPSGLGAQVFGGEGVHIGDYCLSMEDFCAMVRYVLTNTNMEGEQDPRLKLVGDIKNAQTTEGFIEIIQGKKTPDLRRLALPDYRTISGE
ncbi:MAG: hypothetical protein Q8L52_00120 [bacterium]|nr:hypothetical protein [bacterium]